MTAQPDVTPLPGRSDDMAKVLGLLLAIGADDDDVRCVSIPGEPSPKSRARYTKAGVTYTPMKDRRSEARTAGFLRRVIDLPMPGNVAIACIFFRSNRQRIDTDNLLKHICDAATGVLWQDDSQVTAIVGLLHLDRELPRTLVAFAHHESSLTRGTDAIAVCERCGKEYPWQGGHHRDRRFCGQRCAYIWRNGTDLSLQVPCLQCDGSFRRKTTEQKFCSVKCARASTRGVPKPTRKTPRCVQCGSPLTHNRGGRCRACWRASPRVIPAPKQEALLEIEP